MNDDVTLAITRHASCCGKIRHKRMADAEVVVNEIQSRSDTPLINAYYCVFCNQFHTGNGQRMYALDDIGRLLRFGFQEDCFLCCPPWQGFMKDRSSKKTLDSREGVL